MAAWQKWNPLRSGSWKLRGQFGDNEPRTASEPRCVGLGDGSGGSAVAGLDPDAALTHATSLGGMAAGPRATGPKAGSSALLWMDRLPGVTHSKFPSPANDYIEDRIDLNR